MTNWNLQNRTIPAVVLLIDDTYELLIDGTYQLLLNQSPSGEPTDWILTTKN